MSAPAVVPLPDPPDRPKRVLILKPSALGDVVTALPVLRGLRRTFPDAHISWLVSTTCADLLGGDDDLDAILPFPRKRLGQAWKNPAAFKDLLAFRRTLREGGFDWVIDLQGLLRSGIFARWTAAPLRAGFAEAREGATLFYTHPIHVAAQHTVDRNIALARALGVDARSEDMTLHGDRRAGHELADRLSEQHGFDQPPLIVVPPTRWATKQYPVHHWRAVVTALARDWPVLLLGSPAPAERALVDAVADGQGPAVVNLAGQTRVNEMVGLIERAAGVLCCDSAAKFIAPAVQTDCVCLVGPTRIEQTGPYNLGRAVVAEVSCQGCLRKRCPHITCMQSIEPARVIRTVEAMLAGRDQPCPS
jgi:lipopolysaccharide heptosyltransferase I